MTPLIKASIATGEDYNIARKDPCELSLRKCFWQIIVYTLYLHIIPQINWELKTLVCFDWLHKDIDCNYFGALLQRTLKNYGAFFIILNKPNWKYKISWCVGTSPSSVRGSLLGLRWVANSAEKYSTSVHLINFCVLLSIFHCRGGIRYFKNTFNSED